MSHELDHWNKAQQQLLNTLGTSLDDPDLNTCITEICQPSQQDQTAFLRSVLCTGARRNPATCETNRGG